MFRSRIIADVLPENCVNFDQEHNFSSCDRKKTYNWSATYSKNTNQSENMDLWLSSLLTTLTNAEHIWYVDIGGWMSSRLIETETTRFVRMQNLLPTTLRGCLACLASHIPLLMKHACSLTPRTVGNEKWMKSFWNSVYDYHNTSTIEGVCLSCIVACNTRGTHYTKDTCTHVLQKMIFAIYSSFSIDIEAPSPVRVSTIRTEVIPFFISLHLSSF